jgi:branched-chain amino acid transport system permease protein
LHCNTGLIGPTFVTGLILGFLYALIALGYTMVYGVLKLINFAHDAVFTIGAVAVFYAFGTWLGINSPAGGAVLIMFIVGALLVGGVASAAGAAGLQRLAYKPLRKRHAARLSYLISAIGASFFVTFLLEQNFLLGPGQPAFPNFMASSKAFGLFGSNVTNIGVLIAVTTVLCLVALDRVINQTNTGRSIRALSEDVVAAQLMGVNVDRVIMLTFIIGGFFGGVAGTLYALQFGFVVFNLGFLPGIKAFTAAVLGGIGNIRGAMVGGILLGLIENMSVTCVGNEWRDAVAFVILVLVLIFRPTGLLGERIGG